MKDLKTTNNEVIENNINHKLKLVDVQENIKRLDVKNDYSLNHKMLEVELSGFALLHKW